MELLGTIFLYLHIGGAIVAFGPVAIIPMIRSAASRDPMHGNFALRVSERIVVRVVEPGAVFVFLMGLGLIWTRGWNPFTTPWLAIAIVLFLLTLSFTLFVQLPTVKRMIELTSAASRPSDGRPSGPPPEFVVLAGRAARGTQLIMLDLAIILFMMVFKPFS